MEGFEISDLQISRKTFIPNGKNITELSLWLINTREVLHLFHHLVCFCCFFIRFTCSMTTYGVSLSSGAIGGNIYLVFFLNSIVLIPSNVLATYLVDKYGRKKILISTLVIGAISLITAASFPFKNSGIVRLCIICSFFEFVTWVF